MARFDLYAGERSEFLLDVQTDLISGLNTRIVVPLLRANSGPPPMKRLHPVIEVDGVPYIMATHLMASVSTAELGRPSGNLKSHYDQIIAAIDMIFLGF